MNPKQLGVFFVLTFVVGFFAGGLFVKMRLDDRIHSLKTDESGYLERHLAEVLKSKLDLTPPTQAALAPIIHEGAGEWTALRKRHALHVREAILQWAPRLEAHLNEAQLAVFRAGLTSLLNDYPGGEVPPGR